MTLEGSFYRAARPLADDFAATNPTDGSLRARLFDHERKVGAIAQQLRSCEPGRPVSFRKRAVSHQVPKPRDLRHADRKIDLTELDAILEIDVERRTCTAEPGVTFEALVRATLRHGLVPLVVPELRTITLGGAVAGCSIESMSFEVGGFHDTCLEIEVITARGEVLRCTRENEHRLVFDMVHGAFGTLGVISKLVFALTPAKPFIHVVYRPARGDGALEAAVRARAARRDHDFVDGFVHGPRDAMLALGRFVDSAPYAHAYDWTRVYYKSTSSRREDYLRTEDYFFRYDRGVTNVHPRSFVGRLLFGKVLSSARLLRLAETFRHFRSDEAPEVTLDLFVPLSRAQAFLDWYGGAIGHYPLWCVPYRRAHDYPWAADAFYANLRDDLFVDLAIYGMKQPRGRNIYREIELALPRFNGMKTLISYNYYAEDEFWRVFNKPNYDAVKRLVDPDNVFRDLYTKTCRVARGIADPIPARRAA